MKKTTKKVQDTGAVKVIPPYPRWVKICFALVWVLLIVSLLLVGVLEIKDVETAGPVFGLFLLTLSVVSGYGIYRAFRYFPRRAFCVLALLVIIGVSILLLPAVFQRLFLRVFFGSRSIIFLVLGGLIVGQGILALFWKKAQKLGCFIFYIALSTTLAITGQIYDYVKYVKYAVLLPGRVGAPIDYTPRPQVVSYVDCYESGIVALQINPDESITIINKETPSGRLRERVFQLGDQNTNLKSIDDHVYDYTKYLGVKNGKAIIERVQGHHGPGGMNSYENACPFEIAPFTLVDYANTPEKEQEVLSFIANISHPMNSQLVIGFIENFLKNYGEKGLTDISKVIGTEKLKLWMECKEKEDTEFVDSTCLEKCPSGFFRGEDHSCYSCNDMQERNISSIDECSRCPNRLCKEDKNYGYHGFGYRIWTSVIDRVTECPDSYFLGYNKSFSYDATCVSCSEERSWSVASAEECAKCMDGNGNPIREIYGDRCGLIECPKGMFQASSGDCVSCSEERSWSVASAEECAKCMDVNGNPIREMYGEHCSLIECPKGMFHDYKGECKSCNRTSFFSTSPEECAKCVDEDGNPIRKMYGEHCSLIECPKGMFHSSSGECIRCSIEDSWSVASAEECAKCTDENGNPIREMYGARCGLKCPEGEFRDFKEDCISCNEGSIFDHLSRKCVKCTTEKPVQTTGQECAKCMDENGNPIRKMYKVKNVFLNDGKSTIFTSTIKEVCGLIKCPEGKFPNNLGSCVSCSDEQPHSVDSAEACNSCKDDDGNPTRKIYKNHIGDPRFDNRCGLIKCPEGQFPVVLGGCMPCTHLLPEPVESAEACAVCQDENGNPTRRMYKGTFNHPDVSDGCGLIECPKDMFLGKFGHCISCSDAREYDSTAEECAKCSDLRTYNSETQKCELKV